jgi:hypothetical protein
MSPVPPLDSLQQMQTVTEIALEKAVRQVFTREQAALWVGSRGARLDALLKRAVASREIWRIHRALYCLSDRFTQGRINPVELAQRIHGPSYISLETALSQHGWIPAGARLDAGPARRATFRETARTAVPRALDPRFLPSAMREADRWLSRVLRLHDPEHARKLNAQRQFFRWGTP